MRAAAILTCAFACAVAGCAAGFYGPDAGRQKPRQWIVIRHWSAPASAGPLAGEVALEHTGSGEFRAFSSERPAEGGRSILLREGDWGLLRGADGAEDLEVSVRVDAGGRIGVTVGREDAIGFVLRGGQSARIADGRIGLRVFARAAH